MRYLKKCMSLLLCAALVIALSMPVSAGSGFMNLSGAMFTNSASGSFNNQGRFDNDGDFTNEAGSVFDNLKGFFYNFTGKVNTIGSFTGILKKLGGTITGSVTQEQCYRVTFYTSETDFVEQIVTGSGTATQPENPTKNGYTFNGWYLGGGSDGTAAYDFSTPVTGNLTLTAKWEANTYSLTLNTDGGRYADGVTAPTGYTYGVGLTLPTPVKSGCVFDGWYENNGFIGSSVTAINAMDSGEKIYYAKWIATSSTSTVNGTCGASVEGSNLTWALNDENVLTISGTGTMADYEYMGIAGDDRPWASYIGSVSSVIIEHGVTSIGKGAFRGFTNLTSINITDGIQSIGEASFAECGNLASITMGNSLTNIGQWAFQDCTALTNVTLMAGVTTFDGSVFLRCSNLTNIDVYSGNTVFTSVNGVVYNYTKTELVCCPCGKTGTFEVADGVKTIGFESVAWCSLLTGVSLPNSIENIGDFSFYGCSGLTSIVFPAALTSIGEQAFDGCSSLTSISYTGTQAQWDAVSKGTGAISDSVTVNCTDDTAP